MVVASAVGLWSFAIEAIAARRRSLLRCEGGTPEQQGFYDRPPVSGIKDPPMSSGLRRTKPVARLRHENRGYGARSRSSLFKRQKIKVKR